jgi:hypothetical protein
MKTYIDLLNESANLPVDRARALLHMSRRADGAEPHPPAKSEKPGELLTMADGSKWFHAFDGSQPIPITPENEHNVMVEDITGYDYSKIRKLTDRPDPIGSDDIASPEEQGKARDYAQQNVLDKRAARAAKAGKRPA